ncbi:MAG: 2-oxo acid dehydrogenase subunit E2 [Phycisphaerales bacterium]|nr:MAG: 2-oxo acid dehydrogenase subunit E2 [Phycisphaerales bacterium]
MSIDITMPRLSDTMESGTILKWNVKEGDEVSSGDVVADVETDKATMEMQVYDDGTIARIVVDEGDTVDVGTVIAILAEEGEDPSGVDSSSESSEKKSKKKEAKASDDEDEEDSSDEEKSTATATKDRDDDEDDDSEEDDSDRESKSKKKDDSKKESRREDSEAESDDRGEKDSDRSRSDEGAGGNGRLRVSPVARRLADDHQIDVRNIQGSGPSGRIIKRDVMNAIESGAETRASVPPGAKRKSTSDVAHPIVPAAAQDEDQAPGPLEETSIKLSNMRQTIAKRLVESKTTIPHYQVTLTFNMDPLLELRKTLNQQLEPQGVKLSVNDFLVRACAIAMHRHHEVNASWGEDHIKVHGEVNVGIAISLPASRGGGLVVGVIRNADQMGLRGISAESKRLAEKARTKGLTTEEMSDSTFTISNLGMFGVEHFTAIINPPNSAILAVGAAIQKPVVRDGALAVGHEMQATLSLDHRVIDGAMAAEYLRTLKQIIENPASVLV